MSFVVNYPERIIKSTALILIVILSGCEPRVEGGNNGNIPKSEVESLKKAMREAKAKRKSDENLEHPNGPSTK